MMSFCPTLLLSLCRGLLTGLLNLLPSECVQVEQDAGIPDDLASAFELFKGDLPHDVMFSTEYYSRVQVWKECSTTIPHTLVGALKNCSSLSYPNLAALLKIALTQPVKGNRDCQAIHYE